MISPNCHKDLPKIEHSLLSSIVELRQKGLPSLHIRNHRVATKIVICFAPEYACFACLAGTRGKPFVTKRQKLWVFCAFGAACWHSIHRLIYPST